MSTTRVSKASTAQRNSVAWETDNALSKKRSSMAVLIDWLTTPENYDTWMGRKGITVASKQVLHEKIVEEMKKEGITYRKEADIRSNISTIPI
ncbi:hypothetical protein EC973_004559 [Apophysomyces ossiformis]|uniref:Uncharacterized protein n=1 Tax=Apophysomyces ossiformis TaxID=679940 RepID=A0A8H7EUV6_9FUNG|nr:hypothetical protein EC973_004559 [Apophysomyces ossiformis]